METELSFLITLLLEHKLPKATKELVKERVKALQALQPVSKQPMAPIPQRTVEQAQIIPESVMTGSVPLPPRIVGGEVSTGAGIRGPRKY